MLISPKAIYFSSALPKKATNVCYCPNTASQPTFYNTACLLCLFMAYFISWQYTDELKSLYFTGYLNPFIIVICSQSPLTQSQMRLVHDSVNECPACLPIVSGAFLLYL